MLTTLWNKLVIVIPDKDAKEKEPGGNPVDKPGNMSQGYELGYHATHLLNKEFTPYEDGKIPFHHETVTAYMRDFMSGNSVESRPDPNTLHVCFYDDTLQLEDMNRLADFVIGVKVQKPGEKIDFKKFNEQISQGLENVIHTRMGVHENATVLAAHALYIANPKLVPSRFTSLRQKKSQANVEEFLKLWKVRGKNFEATE